MKLCYLVFAVLLLANVPVQAQDLSTPEAAVRSLLTGFCKGDIGEAINCVENAKYSSLLDPMGHSMKLSPYAFSLSSVQSQIDADRATVTMQVSLQQSGSTAVQQFASTVKLHHLSGGWHIVVNRDGPFQPGKPDPVNAAVRALAEPHAMEVYLKTTRDRERIAQGCVSNLTTLATASLMLLQHHDRRYNLTADSFQKFLDPYVPNRAVFRCPGDRKGAESYAFNANLVGVLYGSIKDPSTVVAIYEGRGGKLRFKHEGKAGVAFADGHVKMISEEEAKTLRWEP
jgi:prepilin-type processing-associated H-X9-DG protein